jgi:benzoyl-CoA reductase subunit D
VISAGVDSGARNTKVVLIRDGEVIAESSVPTGFEQADAAQRALDAALEKAGVAADQLDRIVATGAGRTEVPFADAVLTEVTADAKGAVFVHPETRTVIDVGAEEGRGIRCEADGRVVDFATNERCAAGAGSFTEAMARALEVSVEEIGPLSLRSKEAVPMNAQCAVFAESEVVSLIHARTPKEDIARAVHDAIASRITSMVRKVGFERDVALVGGVARNVGFVHSINEDLGFEVFVPESPEFVGALGAALAAGGG